MERPSPITDYPSALSFLFDRINYERTSSVPYRSRHFKLDRMRELLRRLGDPQDQLRIVHVAGTKGKGSTCTMISSVLTTAGYRTGLYTSPHLHRMEERLVIDGQCCSESELFELVARMHPVIQALDRQAERDSRRRGPTYFEITTALAFQHFVDRALDAVVLEVGLGGRLDSTNVCSPLVSVITSISFDHMKQLGDTLGAIAREKAGIIKPGIPVVSGVADPEPREVIAEIADRRGCPLFEVGTQFGFGFGVEPLAGPFAEPSDGLASPPSDSGTGSLASELTTMSYWEQDSAGDYRLPNVRVGLLGHHQAANAAVAISTLRRLVAQGWKIDEASIRKGLAEVRCPARIEVVSHEPLVIIDAAHNLASIDALVQVLREPTAHGLRSAHPSVLIFAASRDKDATGMLQRLLPHFDRTILTRYQNNPRAVEPSTLLAVAQQLAGSCHRAANSQLVACDVPQDAWQLARSWANQHGLICVTGSFFIAAELRPLAVDAIHSASVNVVRSAAEKPPAR